MDLGTAALRGLIGPLFVGHGAQKLWGRFGGHGLEGTGAFFEQLGLRPGKRHATAAGWSEVAGGALLTAGALTPVATTLVSATMVTAIRKVHGSKGPWVTEGGWEYNAALIAAMAVLAEHGPGSPSVDSALFPWMKGKGFALASIAAAVAGSYLVTERFSEQDTGPAEREGAPGDPTVTDDSRFTRDEAELERPSAPATTS
jgi:putative oxidoreductase